jgi:hypothetical protein
MQHTDVIIRDNPGGSHVAGQGFTVKMTTSEKRETTTKLRQTFKILHDIYLIG